MDNTELLLINDDSQQVGAPQQIGQEFGILDTAIDAAADAAIEHSADAAIDAAADAAIDAAADAAIDVAADAAIEHSDDGNEVDGDEVDTNTTAPKKKKPTKAEKKAAAEERTNRAREAKKLAEEERARQAAEKAIQDALRAKERRQAELVEKYSRVSECFNTLVKSADGEEYMVAAIDYIREHIASIRSESGEFNSFRKKLSFASKSVHDQVVVFCKELQEQTELDVFNFTKQIAQIQELLKLIFDTKLADTFFDEMPSTVEDITIGQFLAAYKEFNSGLDANTMSLAKSKTKAKFQTDLAREYKQIKVLLGDLFAELKPKINSYFKENNLSMHKGWADSDNEDSDDDEQAGDDIKNTEQSVEIQPMPVEIQPRPVESVKMPHARDEYPEIENSFRMEKCAVGCGLNITFNKQGNSVFSILLLSGTVWTCQKCAAKIIERTNGGRNKSIYFPNGKVNIFNAANAFNCIDETTKRELFNELKSSKKLTKKEMCLFECGNFCYVGNFDGMKSFGNFCQPCAIRIMVECGVMDFDERLSQYELRHRFANLSDFAVSDAFDALK